MCHSLSRPAAQYGHSLCMTGRQLTRVRNPHLLFRKTTDPTGSVKFVFVVVLAQCVVHLINQVGRQRLVPA